MYTLELSEEVEKKFDKLAKRQKDTLRIIHKKIEQILDNPTHFKPLRGDMYGARRVHIDSSFVLTYEILEEGKIVRILDFAHHDEIY